VQLSESPETLPTRNRHLEFDATEKLGELGRQICTLSRTSPKSSFFTLNCDQVSSLSLQEGAAFCGLAFTLESL